MLDLPVHSGLHDGGPIDPDVLFIVEPNELLAGEQCAIVCDDGVRYSKAMDDVEEEQHSLLGFDRGYWSSFNPFVNLSMVTSRWVKPPGAFLSGPTRSSPQTTKGHVMGIT